MTECLYCILYNFHNLKMDHVKVKRENKKLTAEELEKLSKEELIEKLLCSEAHNAQLKNIISRNVKTTENKNKNQKSFDFSKTHFRHVLLKFYYLGWEYQGYVVQEDTINTIEHYLFEALLKTCLIKDRESSNYHRCGRTDKGVSSFGQVISINLRSKLSINEQSNVANEINYCKILNRVLPENIQCVSWCPVPDDYSARFNCKSRTYRYFFPKGNLDISSMKTGLEYLVGCHDFRNFCKMDVGNGVIAFTRNILEANIELYASNSEQPYDMYQLIIKGQAFLWHQIRCIVAVLFLIGNGRESPNIVKELLDVEKNPRKPDYNLARDIPLNLFYCEYDNIDNWIYDQSALADVISNLQKLWTVSSIQTTMMKAMLDELENKYKQNFDNNLTYNSMTESLVQGVKCKVYKPLMERQKCDALEDRIQHYVKKRKLVVDDSTS